jgi:large subunit ribosomal protein LP2
MICCPQVAKVVAELAGKDLTDLIAEGRKKVGSVPSGGAAAPAAAAGENFVHS